MIRPSAPPRRRLLVLLLLSLLSGVTAGALPVDAVAQDAPSPLTALLVRGEVAQDPNGHWSASYLGPGQSVLLVDGRDGVGFGLGTVTGQPDQVSIGGGGWRVLLPRDLPVGSYATERFGAAEIDGEPTVSFDVSGDGRGCNQLPGQVTVTEAEWSGGAPVRLALSFRVHCEEAGRPATVGALRWASSVPLPTVLDDAVRRDVPATQVGSSSDIPVRVRPGTSAPVSLGAVRLEADAGPSSDWQLAHDGCSGVTLRAGETCDLLVRFAPLTHGDRRAVLLVPDGQGVPHPVVLDRTAAPLPGQPRWVFSVGLLDRVLLEWGTPASSPQEVTGYVLERADSSAPGGWRTVAQHPAATDGLRRTLPGLGSGVEVTHAVRAVYADGSFGPRSHPHTARTLSQELLLLDRYHGLRVAGVDPATPLFDVGVRDELAADLAVSPSGRYAAWVTGNTGSEHSAAFLLDLDDPRRITRLTNVPDVADVAVAFAGEDHLVVTRHAVPARYSETPVDQTPSVVLLRRGAGAQDLTVLGTQTLPGTSGLSDAAALEPGPSPVLVATAVGGGPLLRVEPDGSRSPLAGTDGGREPAVGPDGSVAFVRDVAPAGQSLHVRRPDGSVVDVPLPAVPGGMPSVQTPSFTPDGTAVLASVGSATEGVSEGSGRCPCRRSRRRCRCRRRPRRRPRRRRPARRLRRTWCRG